MSTTVIAVFVGINTTNAEAVVPGPGGAGSLIPGIQAGDKIAQVVSIAGPLVGSDQTNQFVSLIPDNGIVLQKASSSLSAYTFLALLTRG